MTVTLSLAELMHVQPAAAAAAGDANVFAGRTEAYEGIGIYGGHYLGQALAAAFQTVAEPKRAHSMHAYFLRRGNPELEFIDYRVTALREGRGYEVRRISAWQQGHELFTMLASFKPPEAAADKHQPQMPPVKSAAEIIAAREARGEGQFPFPMIKGGRTELEFATPSFREYTPGRKPVLQTWMRVPGGAQLSAREAQCVLAFLCDGTLMFNSVLPYGAPFETHRLTSLDHSAWFHNDANPGEWMLYDQRSTAAADGRGMNHGEIYAANGLLLLSCAQESMLRRMAKTGA